MCPILEKLISLICAFGWLDPADVDPSADFSDLNFDSLDHVALLHDVEDAFQIVITDAEAIEATSVHRLYQIILSKDMTGARRKTLGLRLTR
jgi:acyl carrier protein